MAALEHGKASAVMKFPATSMGIEAIRRLLSGYGKRMRLAVAGGAALSLALALGDPGRETFIVASSVADQAAALAHYADHAV